MFEMGFERSLTVYLQRFAAQIANRKWSQNKISTLGSVKGEPSPFIAGCYGSSTFRKQRKLGLLLGLLEPPQVNVMFWQLS